eukprot:m.61906 g.61906  ORF g.61906 m.61906 type:complete len:815 (+) comp11462_c0_seq1:191-2635(+)
MSNKDHMTAVAEFFRSSRPQIPPAKIAENPPLPNQISKGWLKLESGALVHAGARVCKECRGDQGENQNEHEETCKFFNKCAKDVAYTKDLPEWAHVGLFPAHAYQTLGITKFFEAARTLRKQKKSDAAVVIAWSYCFGLKHFPLASLQPENMPFDGEGYPSFKQQFAMHYGPAGLLYPGPKALVAVTRESAQESGMQLQEKKKKKSWNDLLTEQKENAAASIRKKFASKEENAVKREAPPTFEPRPCIGTDLEKLLDDFRGSDLSENEKAQMIAKSEYYAEVLAPNMFPIALSARIDELLGGKRSSKKTVEKGELSRWQAAAVYDKESKRREYEVKRFLGKQRTEEVRVFCQARQKTNGDFPAYPSITQLNLDDAFRAVLQEDEKICKSWGPTWFKKKHKVLTSGSKIAADAVVKSTKLVENVGCKTDKTLRNGKSDALEKWPKQETSLLNKRSEALKKGQPKSDYKAELQKINPKYAGWATELRMSNLYFECLEAQSKAWRKFLDKAQVQDLKVRQELFSLELSIFNRVKKAKMKPIKDNAYDVEKVNCFFANLYAKLRGNHAKVQHLIEEWYRQMKDVVYPLHDWDDPQRGVWSSDEKVMIAATDWQRKATEAKATPMNPDFVTASPTAVDSMPPPTEQPGTIGDALQAGGPVMDIAPASVVFDKAAEIMADKLSSGDISPEEYEQMMRVNDAMREMEEEEDNNADVEEDAECVMSDTFSAAPDVPDQDYPSPTFGSDNERGTSPFFSPVTDSGASSPATTPAPSPGNPFMGGGGMLEPTPAPPPAAAPPADNEGNPFANADEEVPGWAIFK